MQGLRKDEMAVGVLNGGRNGRQRGRDGRAMKDGGNCQWILTRAACGARKCQNGGGRGVVQYGDGFCALFIGSQSREVGGPRE
jgi:hypothetical protein